MSDLRNDPERFRLEELEPRILLSADAAGLFTGFGTEVFLTPSGPAIDPDPVDPAAGLTAATLRDSRRELAFVDSSIDGLEQLLADLRRDRPDGVNLEIVLIDSATDGIRQITDTLGTRTNLDAVHIFSHGNTRGLQLGTTWLAGATIDRYEAELTDWRSSLGADADLLLYGCSLARTSEGRALVDSIQRLTGADVAASTDDTGHRSLDSDWDLEYRRGQIETTSATSLGLEENWQNRLSIAVDATSTDTSSGGDFAVTHNTSGSNRLMLVAVSMNLATGSEVVSSITYNGDSLSLVGTAMNGDARVEIWSLLAPDIVSAKVNIVFSSPTDGNTAGVMTFTGVDQTTPLGTFASANGSTGNASVTVSSASDELVFSALSVAGITNLNLAAVGGSVEQWDLFENPANGGGSTLAGAASVDMRWNWPGSNNWAIGGVSIQRSITPPVITLPGAAVSFTEGDSATIIDGSATITDVDSPDFGTGNLTVDFTANGTADDRLAINDEGAGAGNISLSGTDVTYDFGAGPVVIGSFSGGTDGSTPLVVTFNSSATPIAAQALARNITFHNASDTPSTAVRSVRFVVSDSDGATSLAVTENINVTAANDDPVLTLPGGAISFTEGDSPKIIDASATVTDVDSVDFDSGTLTVDFSANGSENDRLTIRDQGAGVGNISLSGTDVTYDFGAGAVIIGNFTGGTDGSTPLVITFNANATATAIEALTRNITYENVSTGPATLTRTVRFVLTDGDSGTSSAGTTDVDVKDVDPLALWIADDGSTLVEQFGDTGFSLESPATAGSLTATLDLADFGSTEDLNALHTVQDTISVGGMGVTSMTLNRGDIILSVTGTTTLGGVTVNAEDLGVFQPTTSGDYSSGSFTLLVNDLGATEDITAVTLIEQDTIVPGSGTLEAGSFLYVAADEPKQIWHYDPVTANRTLVVDGDIGSSTGFDNVAGIDLVETDMAIGGRSLTAGQILVSLDGDDGSLGTNMISVRSEDVFILTLTSATVYSAELLFDGSDASYSGNVSGLTTAVALNHDPSIDLPGGPVNFTEGDGQTVIDATATLCDVDLGDFDTGTLTVDFTANSTADDRLAIRDQGAGVGNISLSGSDVTYDFGAGAVVIGSFSGGTDGSTPLVITLNANSTDPAVEALIRNIAFDNVSQDPSTAARTVRFVLTDGDTGTSGAVTKTVNVTPSNDDPVIALPGGSVSFTEGDGATVIDATATVSDVDSTDLDSGALTVDFTANGTASDRLAINDQGAGVGNISLSGSDVTYDFGAGAIAIGSFTGGTDGTTPLVVTLNSSATTTAVQALARNITFNSVSQSPSIAARTVRFVVTDGDGGTSAAATKTVNVAAVNSDPILTLPGSSVSFTEGDGATIIDSTATVGDIDSPDFDSGTLTVDFTANGTANDRLAISDQGAGVGNISLSGSDVTYDFGAGAVVIGSYAGGTDGSTPLVITLNSSATVTAIQALTRNITFENVAQDPSTAARTVRFVLTDGDTGTSGAVTETINVAAVNDDPVLTLPGGAVSFTEGDGATLIDATATVSDVDSADFDTATLTIDFTANGTANDRLAINDQGVGVGNISLSGSDVTYDFGAGAVVIGSFTGGTDGSTPLVITLNASATATAAQALTRNITFDNVSQDPATAARTVRFVLTDGDTGTSGAITETINVTAVNDDPVLALPGGALNFTEGDGATVIDATATVSDVDSADFDTATLTVDFTANGSANDRLAINDQGAGVGNISLSGSDVTYDFGAGAVVIGSFTGGTDGSTPLVITLNSSATATAVQALTRNITFDNVSQDPSTAARTVRFVLTDGDTGTSGAVTETINVAAVNDDPVLTLPGGAVSFTEGDGATFIDATATVSDVDSADFDTATLTIDFTANGTANDRLAINDQGVGVGNIRLSGTDVTYDFGAGAVVIGSFTGGTDGSTPFVITLNSSATATAVQALTRNITFDNVSQDPATAARTVRFVLTDGDTGTSGAITETINVAAVNDDPVLTLPGGAVSFTEGDGATVIDATATVSDVDSADFDTATLTVDFTANGTANDRLAINDQGAGVGNISLSGVDVTYDFGAGAIVIGSFAGGTDGSTPLVITLNASATATAVQALTRNITFDNVSQDPSTTARTVRFVLTDGDSGTSGTVTETINVAAVNDDPVLALPGGALNFTEGDGATVIDATATVSDVDSADFDTATLTVDFTANGTANDRLAINDQGAGAGNISLSGSDVTYDFGAGAVVIGSFTGGTDGSTPLVITLNSSATVTAVQALTRNITFENISQDPATAARTVRFVLTDGDSGTSGAVTETINVSAVNDDPVLALPSGPVSFTEGDGATIIDATATVGDVDSSEFDTGTLTVDFTANGTANDRLAINDQGVGVGNISLSGSDVTYDFGAGAVVIGSFTGGTDGSTPLVITLDSSATATAVQALTRNITFDNVSENPATAARTVRFVLTDGDTGTSGAVTETINVTSVNDDPVLALPGGVMNFTEGDGATVIDGTATVSDVDSADFDTATLTVDFTANGTANDRLAINDQGAGVGNISLSGADVTYDFGAGAIVIGSFTGGTDGSTPLVITLNSSATATAVQALTRNITFDNVSQDPSTTARTVRFVLTDGDTGTSGTVTETINVAAVIDDPVLGMPGGAVTFTEGDGETIIDATATVSDVDSADFDTATLTIDFSANGTTNDRLGINDQGAGAGNISLSGSDVTYDFGAGAVIIGSFTGGTDGSTPLVITLNSSATVTAVQALTRNITFENISQDPATAARTVRFVLTDGDSGTSGAVTETINVSAVNDDPVLTLPGGALSFTEGDGATIIDATATVGDVDSSEFDTGTLTVDFTANGTANDRLAINDEGVGVGNISLSGSDVTYDFGAGAVVIGSFTGGTDGSTPLVITLDSSATATAVQALTRNITFDNVSENPATAARTVRFVLTDGDTGTSGAVTETINVTSVNDDPVLALPGGVMNFTEGDGATAIDATATVSDVDSSDFDTATLTVDFTANGTANDRLAINDQGAGVGNIRLSGADVTYDFGAGAIVIGSFTGGTDGSTPLVITLNSSATATAVQALTRNITFDNVSQDPSTAARTVRFLLTDGDTGTTGSVTETITVTAVNDDPILSLPGDPVSFTVGSGAIVIDDAAVVSDLDSADFDTGTITVEFAANGTPDDRVSIRDQGVGSGKISLAGSAIRYDFGAGATTIGSFAGGMDGTTPLVITLNANADAVAVQALIRNITFDNVSTSPLNVTKELRFVVADGDGGFSSPATQFIGVSNQTPTVSDAAFSIRADALTGSTVGIVSASDPDSGDQLAFSIEGGNTGGAFAIDPNTGLITVNHPDVLGTVSNFFLTVVVDDGHSGGTNQATVIVTVEPGAATPNSDPPLVLSSSIVSSFVVPGIGDLRSTDSPLLETPSVETPSVEALLDPSSLELSPLEPLEEDLGLSDASDARYDEVAMAEDPVEPQSEVPRTDESGVPEIPPEIAPTPPIEPVAPSSEVDASVGSDVPPQKEGRNEAAETKTESNLELGARIVPQPRFTPAEESVILSAALDDMGDALDRAVEWESERDSSVLDVIEAGSIAVTAGVVAWLCKASSILAPALSNLPLVRATPTQLRSGIDLDVQCPEDQDPSV